MAGSGISRGNKNHDLEIGNQAKNNVMSALRCRWNRELAAIKDQAEWNSTLNKCLQNIQRNRIKLGQIPFHNNEILQFNEPKYSVILIPPFYGGDWNADLFLRDDTGQLRNLKSWLDNGGDVNSKNL